MLAVFFLAPVFFSCKSPAHAATADVTAEADSTRRFEYIVPPDTLSTPQARARYVTAHFWDRYDFADTTLLSLPQVSEQGYADFLNILSHVDTSLAYPSMKAFMEQASQVPAARDHFFSLAEKYLYDPNSPMRDEEMYLVTVRRYLSDPNVPDASRIRPQAQLENLLKNRVGTRAADFGYETLAGKRGRLYGIKTPYTLLYFNNPECENCHMVTARMKDSPLINDLIESGHLTVLSVYPDGQVEIWKNHASDFPAQWIVARDRDRSIDNNRLYDLRAIPSLYLLGKDKTVLLKDAALDQVNAHLAELRKKSVK